MRVERKGQGSRWCEEMRLLNLSGLRDMNGTTSVAQVEQRYGEETLQLRSNLHRGSSGGCGVQVRSSEARRVSAAKMSNKHILAHIFPRV